jgi:hypothetical protein
MSCPETTPPGSGRHIACNGQWKNLNFFIFGGIKLKLPVISVRMTEYQAIALGVIPRAYAGSRETKGLYRI